jgi:hypothetical protein
LIDDDEYRVALIAMVVLEREIAIALPAAPLDLYIRAQLVSSTMFGLVKG